MTRRKFSVRQVTIIVTFVVIFFYRFRKEINGYFDQIDAYSTVHPEVIQRLMRFILGFSGGIACLVIGMMVYYWKILPWRHRRREAKFERERFKKKGEFEND